MPWRQGRGGAVWQLLMTVAQNHRLRSRCGGGARDLTLIAAQLWRTQIWCAGAVRGVGFASNVEVALPPHGGDDGDFGLCFEVGWDVGSGAGRNFGVGDSVHTVSP